MSCEFATINRIFIVKWNEPTLDDVARVLAAHKRATQATGRPMIFLAVIPEDTVPPPANVRKALDDGLPSLCADSEAVHFIVEGTGFKHTILRAILAANILAGSRRGKVFVASSAEEAVCKAAPAARMELTNALMLAGARGFVKTTGLAFPQPPQMRRGA